MLERRIFRKNQSCFHRFQPWAATVLLGTLFQMPSAYAVPNSPRSMLYNEAAYTYDLDCDPQNNGQRCTDRIRFQGKTPLVGTQITPLVDPLGQITGCSGELLADYTGFKVGLYEADPTDPTGTNLQGFVSLTQTEVPDSPGNAIPAGLKPNTTNANPYFLTNGEKGTYNFLLDVKRGQVEPGKTYVLVISPPVNSIYSQRRIRIAIGNRSGNSVSYVATAIDGKPLSASNGQTAISGSVTIENADVTGLVLGALGFSASVCQNRELQITKTGDRATVIPGDTVIYRLSIRNLASSEIDNLTINDTLPLGFNFLTNSVRAEFQGAAIPVTTTRAGSTITFNFDGTQLPKAIANQNAVLNLVYAATVTPDAVRGSGQNIAIVQGQRADNRQFVKDGPASHRLRIRSGAVSDCGTIIGRVFLDKNFDGEQQTGEPGIPNAVIFLNDGNRITTDENGMFSIANVLPGYHTGVLDLGSIPGYTLAPNRRFIERNSQSRLVRLEPNGLVRMNFAVTPAQKAGAK